MLACKRGHDKVVEVLVSMGAEIFMRDCRGRTARDTATRRQHLNLLPWLDTQVQVRRLQEKYRMIRTILLNNMQLKHQSGKLRLIEEEQRTAVLVDTVRLSQRDPFATKPFLSCTSLFPTSQHHHMNSNTAATALATVGLNAYNLDTEDSPAMALVLEVFAPSPSPSPSSADNGLGSSTDMMLKPKPVAYADWMWPLLLKR